LFGPWLVTTMNSCLFNAPWSCGVIVLGIALPFESRAIILGGRGSVDGGRSVLGRVKASAGLPCSLDYRSPGFANR
jgi:hypothetical protein